MHEKTLSEKYKDLSERYLEQQRQLDHLANNLAEMVRQHGALVEVTRKHFEMWATREGLVECLPPTTR